VGRARGRLRERRRRVVQVHPSIPSLGLAARWPRPRAAARAAEESSPKAAIHPRPAACRPCPWSAARVAWKSRSSGSSCNRKRGGSSSGGSSSSSSSSPSPEIHQAPPPAGHARGRWRERRRRVVRGQQSPPAPTQPPAGQARGRQ
jgi:hypothetical protein